MPLHAVFTNFNPGMVFTAVSTYTRPKSPRLLLLTSNLRMGVFFTSFTNTPMAWGPIRTLCSITCLELQFSNTLSRKACAPFCVGFSSVSLQMASYTYINININRHVWLENAMTSYAHDGVMMVAVKCCNMNNRVFDGMEPMTREHMMCGDVLLPHRQIYGNDPHVLLSLHLLL